VAYNGTSYIGIQAGTNHQPDLSPAFWSVLSQIGSTGATGATGVAGPAGATGATVLALHLRPGTREWFLGWLSREYPALVEPYRRLYARGAYVDRRYRDELASRVAPLLRRHGLAGPGTRRGLPGDTEGSLPAGVLGPAGAGDRGEQLTLL